jgi:single-strand DNA-binding protein
MNSVNLIGRLTRDPEMRKDGEGGSVCSFTLAVDDARSKGGRADFIRVEASGGHGDLCERYLRKGFLAGVTGRLRHDGPAVPALPSAKAAGTGGLTTVIADAVRFLQWPEKEGGGDADGAGRA